MNRFFEKLLSSLLFRVFAPVIIISIAFTYLGAKILYKNSLQDLKTITQSNVNNEVKRVFYITESKYTTLFLTHGSDQEMFRTLEPTIKQETLTELDKFADYSQYCYAITENGKALIDSCGDTIKLNKINHDDLSYANAELTFQPWSWHIIIYSNGEHYQKIVRQNTITVILSIGTFTAAIIVFFIFIFYIMVRKPFDIILPHLSRMEDGNYEHLGLKSSNEINSLVKGINSLGDTIEARTDELININRSLQVKVDEETSKNIESARIIYEHQRHRALNGMLMNIAHHWRQPLNAVSLMLEDIREEVLDKTATPEYIKEITSLAQHELQNLSGTITRFTRLYEENDELEMIHLHTECLHAVEYIKNIMIFSTLKISVEVAEDIQIKATEQDILEIFIKLLDNIAFAVKKRNQKTVSIRISAASLMDGTMITVEDDAGGIPADILSSVFEPYTSSSFNSKQKGLGLYILKRLIEEKYKGSIKAENTSKGARITIFLSNI
ncbi:MAG: sensor histidine kinase [Deferribacterales bacterium]